ncbi:unnamed protein product [Cyprideis torosa]|uniref:Uncharacterized protein n=1 Tax=Cyprideis torosa TaxID=163714 RepID=A0A7R8WEB3_9CRUS|nr:unnamed protein product [Cyprideis torosa]CAG0892686.1 unnamed protein product [Cyprideis torosa]
MVAHSVCRATAEPQVVDSLRMGAPGWKPYDCHLRAGHATRRRDNVPADRASHAIAVSLATNNADRPSNPVSDRLYHVFMLSRKSLPRMRTSTRRLLSRQFHYILIHFDVRSGICRLKTTYSTRSGHLILNSLVGDPSVLVDKEEMDGQEYEELINQEIDGLLEQIDLLLEQEIDGLLERLKKKLFRHFRQTIKDFEGKVLTQRKEMLKSTRARNDDLEEKFRQLKPNRELKMSQLSIQAIEKSTFLAAIEKSTYQYFALKIFDGLTEVTEKLPLQPFQQAINLLLQHEIDLLQHSIELLIDQLVVLLPVDFFLVHEHNLTDL